MAVAFRDELAHHLQGQSLVRADKHGMINDFAAIHDAPKKLPKKKRAKKVPPMARHVVIPDTQVRPDTPTAHLEWIAAYICDQYGGDENLTIIHLGDHWDMPSLSSYDAGKKSMENRRVVGDIIAGNRGFDLLNGPLAAYNEGKRKKWLPRKVFLHGNHEDRITRAVEDNAQLEGLLSLDLLNAKAWGWEVHPYREIVKIDGISYSHLFYHPLTGRPYGGMNVETRLKTIGHSFTMGHQQVFLYGVRATISGLQAGLVCGAAYLHEEEYRGPQAQAEWRGIIVKNEVRNGTYDIMPVSLGYLCRRYEGMSLAQFRKKYL